MKAHLVPQRFSQVEGVDFEETYSPFVKFPSNRVMLALAISKRWNIHHLGMDNALFMVT